MSKFENKISDVDELACKSLTALESKYPAIAKDSTEVSLNQIKATRKYTIQTYELEAITRIKQFNAF